MPIYSGIWHDPCPPVDASTSSASAAAAAKEEAFQKQASSWALHPQFPAAWPRAVIIYAHGFGAHVHDPRGFEKNLLVPLAGHGYAVWGYDARGRGRTGKAAGRFGDIGAGWERMDDLATVIASASARFEDSPVFLMGHSTGASEVLAFMSLLADSPEGRAVQGLVLLAPACDFKRRFPPYLRFLLKVESLRGSTHFDVQDLWRSSEFSKDLANARLSAEHLEHLFRTCDRDGSGFLDLEEFSRALNKEMGLGLSEEDIKVSLRSMDDDRDGRISMKDLLEHHVSPDHPENAFRLKQFKLDTDFLWYDRVMDPKRIHAPTLLVHGRRDRVNKFKAARAFFDDMPCPDKTLELFEYLRNGVAMDMDAPKVLQVVRSWLDMRTSGVA